MECIGGPLDGHVTVAVPLAEPLAVHLFKVAEGRGAAPGVWAYAQTDRFTADGSGLVLEFLLGVGNLKKS